MGVLHAYVVWCCVHVLWVYCTHTLYITLHLVMLHLVVQEVPTDGPFLGPDLVPLLDLTLTISTDIDLLKELDR